MGWRTFARLEVAGAGGRPLFAGAARREGRATPPAVLTNRTLVRQPPIWLLVQKELRLQQLTFVAAAIFVGFYLFVVLRRPPHVDRGEAIQMITAINIIASSLLIGSLASAEERRLGTLDWQLLLPVSAARQWVVKVAVLVALMLLLTFALPVMLVGMVPPGPSHMYRWALPAPPASIVFAIACLTASLYVSSLVSSGMHAFVASLPALFAAMLFIRMIGTAVAAAAADRGGSDPDRSRRPAARRLRRRAGRRASGSRCRTTARRIAAGNASRCSSAPLPPAWRSPSWWRRRSACCNDQGVRSAGYSPMKFMIADASTMSLARKRIECESARSNIGR